MSALRRAHDRKSSGPAFPSTFVAQATMLVWGCEDRIKDSFQSERRACSILRSLFASAVRTADPVPADEDQGCG